MIMTDIAPFRNFRSSDNIYVSRMSASQNIIIKIIIIPKMSDRLLILSKPIDIIIDR